ncbi:MAG: hypothetical protein LRY51_09200, partial [Geovibrio sp.]|nr:hypothetical protein [Geovibrio sp.]
TESPIAELAVKMYLDELSKKGVDTLVLGCTHYPLLKKHHHKALPAVQHCGLIRGDNRTSHKKAV